jgi:tetratricopeptide (TPR) repeat protein
LDHAHEEGVIHRDVKPSNLILEASGKVWVTDFGLARVEADPGMTMTGDILGTLRYMSPEQTLAKRVVVDHRTDVYSLGVTLYELLTLQPAFPEEDRRELMRRIAFEEPPAVRKLNKSVPADLETIVLKAMAKSPAGRYATARELADDAKRFLEDRPIQAKRPNLLQRAAKLLRRHRAVAASVGVTTIILLLAVAIGATLIARQALVVAEKEREKQDAAVAAQHRERVLRQEAQGQQRRAEAYLEIVAEALDKMLARTTNKRSPDVPQIEPVQREMLEDTLSLYRRLAHVSRADLKVQFRAGHALPRLLNRTQFVLSDLLKSTGRAEEAAQVFRLALRALDEAVQLDPSDVQLREMRGWLHARRAHWQQAAADFAKATELDPDNHFNCFFLAHLHLESGDTEGYRQVCSQMLQRFGRTEDSEVARRTSRVCLLVPGAVADYNLPLKLAEQAVTRGSEYPRVSEFVKGMADYRTGQYDSAIKCFSDSIVDEIPRERDPALGYLFDRINAELFSAMAHHRLGQTAKAEQLLAKARQVMEAEFPKVEGGDIGPKWRGWVGCRIALREAEALIGKDDR